ncbi:hypothetical protein OAN33_01225 [Flavobacteriales bacterium]|nr:hypothetical protein [Flavobacteriales bacterium]
MQKIKNRLYNTLKSWLKRIENENHVSKKSKCSIHESVKQESIVLDGVIEVGENSVLRKAKLYGLVKAGKNIKITDSLISGEIIIGDYSKIIDGVELHGNIEIGKNTTINGGNTDLRASVNKITIGNFCSIARNVTFQEYNHDLTKLTTYMVRTNLEGKPFKEDIVSKGGIEIGHDVWIGTQCVILSGVKIGAGAVIAANSVVTEEIPPYAIAGGSPAKVMKYRFGQEKIRELLASNWWYKTHEEIVEMFNKFES